MSLGEGEINIRFHYNLWVKRIFGAGGRVDSKINK